MLEHSRGESGVFQLTDINALIEEDIKLAYHAKRAQDSTFNVEIKTSLDTSLGLVEIVPQDISRVLLNLFNNAFYALQEKRKSMNANEFHPLLSVETKNIDGRFTIIVKDNGTGVPINLRDKVFNPFFTTKPPGEGTGLGLSLSHDIIAGGHRGSIELESEEGAYAQFTLIIPKSKMGIVKPIEGAK
jgi:signal transduction histidine kinase